jgi:hypothetical protein
MYELTDWGQPAPPDWRHRRERIEARLPVDLVRRLSSLAYAEGMSLSELIEYLLDEAVGPVLAAVPADTPVRD